MFYHKFLKQNYKNWLERNDNTITWIRDLVLLIENSISFHDGSKNIIWIIQNHPTLKLKKNNANNTNNLYHLIKHPDVKNFQETENNHLLENKPWFGTCFREHRRCIQAGPHNKSQLEFLHPSIYPQNTFSIKEKKSSGEKLNNVIV